MTKSFFFCVARWKSTDVSEEQCRHHLQGWSSGPSNKLAWSRQCWLTFNGLHSVVYRKIELFTVATVRTQSPTQYSDWAADLTTKFLFQTGRGFPVSGVHLVILGAGWCDQNFRLTPYLFVMPELIYAAYHHCPLHKENSVLCCYDFIQKHTFKNANLISWKKMYVFIAVIEPVFSAWTHEILTWMWSHCHTNTKFFLWQY
jgi:hypothetical protein